MAMSEQNAFLLGGGLRSLGGMLLGQRGGSDPYLDYAMQLRTQQAEQAQAAALQKQQQKAYQQMLANLGIGGGAIAQQPNVGAPVTPGGPTNLVPGQMRQAAGQAPQGQGQSPFTPAQGRFLQAYGNFDPIKGAELLTEQVFKDPETEADVAGFKRWKSGPNQGKRAFPEAKAPAVSKLGKISQDVAAGYLSPDQAAAMAARENLNIKDESSFRKEYHKESANFRDAKRIYKSMQQVGLQGTGAADVSLVFSFFKVLDPISTVRESEVATAEQAASIPMRLINIYNRLVTGEKLAPDQRQELIDAAGAYYRSREQPQKNREEFYTKTARAYGMDPARVVPRYWEPQGAGAGARQQAAPAGAVPPSSGVRSNPTAADALLNKYGISGGASVTP